MPHWERAQSTVLALPGRIMPNGTLAGALSQNVWATFRQNENSLSSHMHRADPICQPLATMVESCRGWGIV